MDPLEERIASRQSANLSRAGRLVLAAQDFATVLAARGAVRVVLFGSLVTNVGLHEGTDIDLCVFGLTQSALLDASLEFGRLASANVDLVHGESMNELLRRAVEREGRVLVNGAV